MNVYKFILSISFILLFHSLGLADHETNGIQYKFNQTDSSYAFWGSFKVKGNTECILNVCFDYEHIKALAPSAENVFLIDQGANWNKIKYEYEAFVFSNQSVWYRKKESRQQKVNFKLLSSINNSSLMPEMTSSSGFYHIQHDGDSLIMNYYQECTLSESIFINLYIHRIKKEAVDFLYWFKKYVISECSVYKKD